MKLHPASLHTLRRICTGTVLLDILMVFTFHSLDKLEAVSFSGLTVLSAMLGGSLVAIANFTILCITVQQTVGMADRKRMQKCFQLSYHVRMIIQAIWVLICYFNPGVNIIAGTLPLFFPKATILFLNSVGKLSFFEEA